MSKILSLFGIGGEDASPPDELDAARDLIARASRNDRAHFISPLRKALAKHPGIAAAFAWLHTHERRHEDDNAAMVMLAALLDGPMFSPAQRRRSAKAAVAELRKALRNKDVPDDVKVGILPVMAMAGQPVDDDAASGFFRDYDAAMRRHSLEFAKNLSDSPASFSKLLLARGFISEEGGAASAFASREAAGELLTLGQGVAQVNPAGATLMAAALIFRVGAPDFLPEHAPEQLDAIHALGTPRARWCLETLANWPGFAMPFRNKATSLAAELAARGIKSQAPLAPGEFSHGLVTMVDGMGSRTATLFHRTPNGGLDAFTVMANDEVGVKDAHAFFENGSELEEMLRFTPEPMSMASASSSLFRELLADSFALHEELGTAPPGSLFPLIAYLGDEPVAPRKREPNLGAYMLDTVRPTPELVAGGGALADSALFGCLFPASDAAYAFCEAHWDKRRKSISAADFPAFLQEVMPLERERLLHRMAINLEVEALAGRAARKDNQTAARLWLGMKENVAPLETIPFIQGLASHGIRAIVEDLRQGFKNQRDAFAASQSTASPPDEVIAHLLGMDDLDSMSKSECEAALTGMLRHMFGDVDSTDFPPAELLGTVLGRGAKPRGKAKDKKKAKGGWVYVGPPEKKSKSTGGKKTTPAKDRNIYRLSVDVRGWPPPLNDFMQEHPGIIREIEIGGNQTLDKLHLAIFRAFEREDMHAYEFQFSDKPMEPGAPRYVHPQLLDDDSDGGLVHNAATTTLDELGLTPGQLFLYWFDFGDDWWHGITVNAVGSPTPRSRYPRVVAKHGFSPPQYPEM